MGKTAFALGTRCLLAVMLAAPAALAQNKPVLVVTSTANPFSAYNSEILKAEGLNLFDSADIGSISASSLSSYNVVILGNVALTSTQVTTLTNWVNSGGRLIALRPDKQLAGLLGLTDAGGTLSEGYLLVNTASSPGAGIVGQTIQFHGTADLYNLNGATAIATLYASASTPTPHPAVTLRTGIGSGGSAAAFTYDLARSVVYTRQGNPAWESQARVGQGGPIRAGDMFYGAASFDPQPDWIDLNKVAIPQADEQQRLLVNLILHLCRDRMPVPRFWYLPFGKKAAVVMTGDDHGNGATAGRFDIYNAASPPGCSVANWECIRATSYIYPNTPMTDAQAAAYTQQGFEVAAHINTGCASYAASSLPAIYSYELDQFASNFPSVPAPVTNRTHCIAWSDWSTQATVSLSKGIRLDTNYYYWPPSWVANRPGFFTGSGIPMRFAQKDGSLINVFQAATQLTDESGQQFPYTINTLLDNAIGPNGYFGVFTANMHTDSNTGDSRLWSDQIVDSAKARGVPVVSAKQMLQWLDAKDTSSFGSFNWSGNTLTFSIAAAASANGLQALIPAVGPSGALTGLSQGGNPVAFSIQTLKGIDYAVFSAASGTYTAVYSSPVPPVISSLTASPGTTSATITWVTDKNASSRVDYGTSPSSLNQSQASATLVTNHSVLLTGLSAATTYYFRVISVDADGGSAVSPAPPAAPASLTTIDPTPPVISAIAATPGMGGTATISWATNKLATSRVDYGTSNTALNSSQSSSALVTSHSLTLSGLQAGVTYYYRVTSVDAVGNSATSPAPPSVPASFVQSASFSVWSSTSTPAVADGGDSAAVELGMKFRSDISGLVTGVRFYKSAANTGTHIGNLWTSTGTLLGSVTFTNETSSGWQQANFAAPIPIAANTTYIVSYHAPNGRYSINTNFFTSSEVNNPPLRALQNGVDGPNGVYRYGSTSGFPNLSWNASNYWVDVVFIEDNQPPVISSVTATTTETSANITWTTNKPATSRVDYGTSPGSLTQNVTSGAFDTSHSVTLPGLVTGITYYYRVTSVDSQANSGTFPLVADPPLSFVAADTTPPVISAISASPGSTTAAITWTTNENSTSVVLFGTSPGNLNLSASDPALVTTHSITLTGLAMGTSYYFRVSSADSAGNAATAPAATSLSFTTIDTTPPVISSVMAVPNLGGTATITWSTNKPANSRVDYGTSAGNLDQTVNSATLVTSHSITLTGLAAGATYHFRVTSADALNNSSTSPAPPAAPVTFVQTAFFTVWPSTAVPGTVDGNDSGAVELGMKFRADIPGLVSGVRFYKSAANTGTHIGNLWTSTGTLLGSVTFTNETSSGWQQANFAAPIPIAANTTYIVSYHAPNGRYSINTNFFTSSEVNNPPLRALQNGVDGPNGVYRYGSTSGFPNLSWNASNYWVDVVFAEDDQPPAISNVSAATTTSTATITWTTNKAATSRVDYGTSASALNQSAASSSMVTAHSIGLTGLASGTLYYYRVTSVDLQGRTSVFPASLDPPLTFTPATAPAPVITSVSATAGSTSAIVTWTTDIAANSQVVYGTSPSNLSQNVSSAAQTSSHSLALSGLSPSTVYHYRVTSTTSSGGSATSPNPPASPLSFTTSASSGGEVGSPPSEWEVSGAGDPTIQGFPTDISVNRGETISFKINTPASAYIIDIYRMGYYSGNGAAKVATINPSASLPQSQPTCVNNLTTGLFDCGNWAVSASWAVPANAKSGIYFARPRRLDTNGASHIFFVVRDDSSTSDIIFQTSDTTWQAYNQYGGNSLYVGQPVGRAYKVSYNRPIITRSTNPEDFVFNAEYPMVRWLEANGYDVTYTTGVDTDRRGNLLLNHKLFLSVGHDEYWSGTQRTNVEAARDAGVHLAFFSGNEVFWKTRWEDNHRTLVCYKETAAGAKIDPSPEWTGTWRDTRFSPPSDGGRPENALTGTIFTVNCCDPGTSVRVPASDGKMRFWRNTGLGNQAPGSVTTLTTDTLSYEWNEDLDNGHRPAGMIRLSTSTYNVNSKLQDFGWSYAPGTATHNTTLYRAPSGALVFGAGTIQWTWGLDSNHDRGNPPADPRMQQAVVNLFADMGIQPTNLQPGLVPATASTDATPPSATISAPTAGATLAVGVNIVISGTAVDVGGGVVGGIEVSTDGGVTWRRAEGRETWTYSWTPSTVGPATIQVRATDDSLNTQPVPASVSVNVESASGGGASTIWPPTATPTVVADSGTAAVELGLKFRSSVAGQVTGVRFYKSVQNTGTHIGNLWTSTGTLLATVTFTNETSSGWQQANFSTPVAIQPNVTYVISYFCPNGGYSYDTNYFATSGVNSPPLKALQNGEDGTNGVYVYGSGGGFPANSWQAANYWVDVVFAPTQ